MGVLLLFLRICRFREQGIQRKKKKTSFTISSFALSAGAGAAAAHNIRDKNAQRSAALNEWLDILIVTDGSMQSLSTFLMIINIIIKTMVHRTLEEQHRSAACTLFYCTILFFNASFQITFTTNSLIYCRTMRVCIAIE